MKSTYTILDEYIDLCNKYQETYGDQTVVLMQVGGFFEMYAVKNDSENLGADIYTISDLLNIQVSRKTKNIIEVSRNNHLLAGFPNHAMKKFLDILVNHNYTVVVVEQVTPPPNPKRAVTNIISSSTYLEQTRPLESSGMMIINLDMIECWKTKRDHIVVGWSYMDVLTGKICCNEITTMRDTKLLIDELQRIVLVENPREVVITSMEGSLVGGNEGYESLGGLRIQLRHLFTSLDVCFHDKLNCLNVSFQEKRYQNEILRKVYPQHGLLSPIEFVNLEARPLALISMVYLIQFAYEHNEYIVMNIPKPQVLDESSNSRLILASNCIHQLDITHQNMVEGACKENIHSLLRILNRSQTAVGRRYFKSRLLAPTQDIVDITANYDRTEAFIKSGIWSTVEKSLSGVLDIERLYRRLQMRKIQPCEFVSLFQSILAVHESIELVLEELSDEELEDFPTLKSAEDGDSVGSFRNSCESTLNMDQALKCNLDTIKFNIFQNGVNPDIDTICEKIRHIMTALEEPVSQVSKGEWSGWIKLDHNETDGYFYTMTGKRFETLKSSPGFKSFFSKSTALLVDGIQKGGKHTAQGVKIQSKDMKTLSNEINQLHESLKTTTTKAFHQFVDELQVEFDTFIKATVRALETLDFHAVCAKNAVRLCHVRPDIDTKEDTSFIDIEDLRHPIIEHIQTHLEYVPNTVKLGSSNGSSRVVPNGMVLYGVNAAGKSSLMKSVGIALIMAQAGMYVSARKMAYHPYAYLFTRIQSRDDIYRGMSTFSMEISELRNILKRANSKSLIIGDELCSGTETISGVSIVCAGIKTLVDAEATFLFATHLHQLTSLNVMTDLEKEHKICIRHLSVMYDENSQALVYDRKLKDGPGQELYGLEVCKALDLDPKFLHLAGQIRHNLLHGTPTMVTNTKSSFNRDVIMNECKVCGASSNNRKLEAHHIQYQSTSDARGFIENRFHKNKQFNLVPLCEKCHDAVHSGELKIHGWIQSTKGVHLRYDWSDDKQYSNYRVGADTVIDTMQKHRHDIVDIRKTNSLKKTNEILKSQYDIVVSEYKLNKWLHEII